ncbi:hypothetical protein ACDX78_02230 [Virgibacillus oceani]
MISLQDLGINIMNADGEMRKMTDIQRDLKEAYSKIQAANKPLLVIELQDETSVPKVFYKGEEITKKIHIHFDWDTDTSFPGGLSYAIEHADMDNGYPAVNKIERRIKDHAAD